ncbi:MAG: CBS domain-containing protein, partial [Halobacteria archaeon]|nr:CBS domain-containing protein [Halobacteria archaeon]
MELPTPDDIRNKRKDLGLTQSQLAERAEVSQPLIARIEKGDVDPRLSTLRRIINVLEHTEEERATAEDLMTEEIESVSPDDTVRNALNKMNSTGYSQLPVLESGVPVGSVSYEIIAHPDSEDLSELPDTKIRDIMVNPFPTVSADSNLDMVSHLLDHNKAVLVTKNGRVVGIITNADVASHF